MTNAGYNSSQPKMPEKIPPQSIEAETGLLGSLMLDKNAIIKVVDFLQPSDFYKQTHQEIYKAMAELFDRKEPIDLLSLSTRLKEKNKLEEIGSNSYLTELVNSVPTASNALNYAKIVQRKGILRNLISTSYDIGIMGYDENEETDILLDQAEKKIFSISQKSLNQNFTPIKETLEQTFERIDRLSKHQGDLRGLATGFTEIDNKLAGLQNSDLIIMAARPSLGKSAFAMDVARNVAVNQKLPVGIFSLEMSKDQISDRLVSATSFIDLWKLRTGRLSNKGDDNDFARIQQSLDKLSQAPIYIDDAAISNILQMRAMARRLQAEHGLGLIIVDYLQLMEPRNVMQSVVQQVTEISRSLKALAKELNVPVLALSQLSRAVEQRSPQIPRLSDLRESGCLAGDTLITNAQTGERISIQKLAKRKKQAPFPAFAVEDNYKIKSRKIVKAFSSGKKMVFEMTTRSGRKIKASANHPFLKLEGWKKLEALKVNDFIALPRKIEIKNPSNPVSEKELILLAHLLGDGCILPRQPFHYTSADKENIEIVNKTAKMLFNIKSKIVKQKNWYHIYLSSPYHLTRGKHHPITNWFAKLGIGLVHSWEKQIPEKVFQCSEKRIALFLKHLWATDGNLSWKKTKGKKSGASIYYASSSNILAQQVQDLLLILGIQSSMRKNISKKKYRTMYHIYVEGAKEQLKFLDNIGIVGERKYIIPQLRSILKKIAQNTNVDIIPKTAWKTIIEPIKKEMKIGWREIAERLNMSYCGSTLFKTGISRQRMERLYLALKNPILRNFANSDIYWDKIVSIKKLGIQDVYDATVQGAHNFMANSIIVHNSLEQDADVVMFIHRPDKYRDDAPKNVAEIIIAKHRNGPLGQVKLMFDESYASFRNLAKEEITE